MTSAVQLREQRSPLSASRDGDGGWPAWSVSGRSLGQALALGLGISRQTRVLMCQEGLCTGPFGTRQTAHSAVHAPPSKSQRLCIRKEHPARRLDHSERLLRSGGQLRVVRADQFSLPPHSPPGLISEPSCLSSRRQRLPTESSRKHQSGAVASQTALSTRVSAPRPPPGSHSDVFAAAFSPHAAASRARREPPLGLAAATASSPAPVLPLSPSVSSRLEEIKSQKP